MSISQLRQRQQITPRRARHVSRTRQRPRNQVSKFSPTYSTQAHKSSFRRFARLALLLLTLAGLKATTGCQTVNDGWKKTGHYEFGDATWKPFRNSGLSFYNSWQHMRENDGHPPTNIFDHAMQDGLYQVVEIPVSLGIGVINLVLEYMFLPEKVTTGLNTNSLPILSKYSPAQIKAMRAKSLQDPALSNRYLEGLLVEIPDHTGEVKLWEVIPGDKIIWNTLTKSPWQGGENIANMLALNTARIESVSGVKTRGFRRFVEDFGAKPIGFLLGAGAMLYFSPYCEAPRDLLVEPVAHIFDGKISKDAELFPRWSEDKARHDLQQAVRAELIRRGAIKE